MKHQELTTSVAMNDAQMSSEVSSRLSTSVGKSKSSFRLFLFTALSVLACAGALANVAAAAAPSGEDQYIEKVPNGGGSTDPDTGVDVVDTNGDGVITQAEVKKAAEKNKKKQKAKAGDDDDGATGATAAVVSNSAAPPAAESVATAAKFGPFSRTTALLLAGLVLLGGIGFFAFGGSSSGLFGIGGGSDGTPPAPPQ